MRFLDSSNRFLRISSSRLNDLPSALSTEPIPAISGPNIFLMITAAWSMKRIVSSLFSCSCFCFPFLFLGYYTADVYRSARCRRGSLCVSFLLQSVFLWIVVFRHRPREIPIFKPALGHRIPTSRRKRITPQNARDGKPHCHEKKTFLKRLKRIPRAGRRKTAGWRFLER